MGLRHHISVTRIIPTERQVVMSVRSNLLNDFKIPLLEYWILKKSVFYTVGRFGINCTIHKTDENIKYLKYQPLLGQIHRMFQIHPLNMTRSRIL